MLTTGFTFPTQSAQDDEGVVQVDVAFLSYKEQGENNANARLDSITYVTLRELIAHEAAKRKKKLEMGKNAYKHFKWVGGGIALLSFHHSDSSLSPFGLSSTSNR